MNGNVKILDCTLRDGGYVNNWDFGDDVIATILKKLFESQLDFVECGYLSLIKGGNSGNTIFDSLETPNRILKKLGIKKNVACMVNYGEYPIEKLAAYKGEGVDIVRIAFHKEDMRAALDYSKKVKDKGYNVFLQPMVTMNYCEDENNLKQLFEEVNKIKPSAVYIVDSFGTMRPQELCSLYAKFDCGVDSDIPIGFHSHNNLQLSFSNSQSLIALRNRHNIIIDSSVFGMGRGAGNLCTELITLYLNENIGSKYKTLPILEIIDEYINPIFIHNPWGYSVPFYIASVHKCHPNYASYLVNKQTLKVKTINLLLSQIPQKEKSRFDVKVIEQIYVNYLSCEMDDTESITLLGNKLLDRNILLLAPGKNLAIYSEKIVQYIEENEPIVIAINFVPKNYDVDYIFVSNQKRFPLLKKELVKRNVIATSNINCKNKNYIMVNYHSLINSSYEEMDNAGVMLLRLMDRVGVGAVTLAGYDGFSTNVHENYCNDNLINSTSVEPLNDRNKCIEQQIRELRDDINIETITPSRYFEQM